MDDRQRSPERPSLLRQQLSILYDDPAVMPVADKAAEASRIERFELPPLDLQRDTVKPSSAGMSIRRAMTVTTLLCSAAAVVFIGLRGFQGAYDDLSVKGGNAARVYWERGGTVHELGSGESLVSGDGLRAEVTAGEPGIAFQLMVDRNGAELAPDLVAAQALRLKRGDRLAFPGFRLVDPAQGERLLIAFCPWAEQASSALAALRSQLQSGSNESPCDVRTFPLR